MEFLAKNNSSIRPRSTTADSTRKESKNQNISKPLKENLHLIFKNFVVYQRLFQAF